MYRMGIKTREPQGIIMVFLFLALIFIYPRLSWYGFSNPNKNDWHVQQQIQADGKSKLALFNY